MPIGIEKIVVVKDGIERNWASFWLPPDFYYEIRVKYYPETPEALKGHAKWILKPEIDGIYSSADQDGLIGDLRNISIEAKFCGPKRFVLEAFDDEPLNRFPTQLKFWGKAPEKIVSTKWSRTNGGEDIRDSKLKYGDTVWLNVQTEGLNGAKLDIDVYNRRSVFSDEKAATLNGVDCDYGEVNVEIKNTYAWREFTGFTASNSGEEFYVKIRVSGKTETILDDNNDDEHARFLTIEDEITSRNVETHQSAQPLTIEENEVNVERFELCHFKKIDITDNKETISIFDEGKIIDEKASGEFHFSDSIHFDVDKSDIRPEDTATLNNVANLLLDNPFIPAEIGAHCDIRASHDYNDALSNRRAIAAKTYLVNKGVDSDKIIANGYGKRRLLIPGEDLNEEEHQINRRLTLRFKISGEDSSTILYQTIAGDNTYKNELSLNVSDYQTDKCLRKGSDDEHDTQVRVKGITSQGVEGPESYEGTNIIKHGVYSTISESTFIPLRYIFPHKSTTNSFLFYINSCRYFFKNDNATVNVIVYPDIKWDFHFFLNLSNSQSVRWNKLSSSKLTEMRQKAGEIGAEQRWQQAEIDFGVVLEAQWNKIDEQSYDKKWDATVKYDSKIRKFYQLFSSLKDISRGITSKTKGKVTDNRLGKMLPFSLEVDAPNFALGAEWKLTRAQKDNLPLKEIGTEIEFYLKSSPLIGLKMVIDLLDLLVQGAVAAVSGGTANVGAKKIFDEVRSWLSDEDHAVSVNMYIDLVLFGTIDGEAKLKYHTVSDTNEGDLKLTSTIGVELKAGIEIKAGVVLVGVEFYANGEMVASGKGSITFGHSLNYSNQALNYKPELKFDGIVVTFVIKAEVGLAIKKGWFSGLDFSTGLDDYEYHDKIVDEFDVIEQLKDFTGIDPEIQLLKNDNT